MEYKISSEGFSDPLLKGLLRKLTDFFSSKGLEFYIIGAVARDIVMRQILGYTSRRRTSDLDIAISIPNWDIYNELSKEIDSLPEFKKSKHQSQKFFMGDYEIDIVPFGSIAKDDENIYWPPDGTFLMSVKGFNEVLNDMISIRVDDEFDIKVTSIKGLFLLKWYAWLDRKDTKSKDAEDMCFILQEYYDIYVDEYAQNDYHSEVFEEDDFDIFVAGSTWLAYDLLPLLNKEKITEFRDMLDTEITLVEESRLFEHMLIQNRALKFDVFQRAIIKMRDIFNESTKEDKK